MTEFLLKHTTAVTDPIVAGSIDYLRNVLDVDRVAVAGYCFGGRYAFRFLGPQAGVDVGFAAHPSNLQDAEIEAIARPVAVAAAETDNLLPPARRHEVEAELQAVGQPYWWSVYSGTNHGFAVRINVTDPEMVFGKETAFLQALRWFDNFL